MDINDLSKVNSLWRKIYPYLVSQIMVSYNRGSGSVLELGPFSGGISLELARSYPGLKITIADESFQVTEYLRQEIATLGFLDYIKVKITELKHLIFKDSRFDLVIFRGAFFFLDQEGNMLREIFRVLKEDGMAFVGGGYGKDTPQELIDEIADESRVLNNRLGRKWSSIEDLEGMVKESELSDKCKIEEEGGVWLNIRK